MLVPELFRMYIKICVDDHGSCNIQEAARRGFHGRGANGAPLGDSTQTSARRVQAQRNAAVDVMNSDGYLSVASGRWKARTNTFTT